MKNILKLAKTVMQFGEIETDKAVLTYVGELAVGVEVFVMENEEYVPAPDGVYTTEEKVITVKDGKVESIEDVEKPAEEPKEEEPKEEEMAEVDELNAKIEELNQVIADKDSYIAELEAKVKELEEKLNESAGKKAEEEFKKQEQKISKNKALKYFINK